jgi:hypothetical protein
LGTQQEKKEQNLTVSPTQNTIQVGTELPTTTGVVEPTNDLLVAPSLEEQEHPNQGLTTHVARPESSMFPAHTDGKGSTSHNEAMAPKDNENTTSDVVMCGTLTAHSEVDHDENWVPPLVIKEFSYPSDEEIVPNPKMPFPRTFLPNLGKVRGWFKGPDGEGNGGASSSTSASCLPISSKRDELESLSHPYVSLDSRLPEDPVLLQRYVERLGMSTRLKNIASKRLTHGSTHSDEDNESIGGGLSDGDSSTSLREHNGSPRYSELAPSIVSEDESELGDENIAPAHMANEHVDKDKDKDLPPDSGAGARSSNDGVETSGTRDREMEEQIHSQQQ